MGGRRLTPWLDSLNHARVSFRLVEGRLQFQAPGPLPEQLRKVIRDHRAELVVIAQKDAEYLAEERAGILEHMAGFSRMDAETAAGLPPKSEGVA